MADLVTQKTATANGTYVFGSSPTSTYSFAVDGSFGGGSVEIGYISAGTFVKYTDIAALSTSGQGVVTCGQGRSIAFKVSGATSPTIQLLINLV